MNTNSHFSCKVTLFTDKISYAEDLHQIPEDIHPVLKSLYRLGTVNSNTVNSKFHLIRSFFEILARMLSFHVSNAQLIQTWLIQSSINFEGHLTGI